MTGWTSPEGSTPGSTPDLPGYSPAGGSPGYAPPPAYAAGQWPAYAPPPPPRPGIVPLRPLGTGELLDGSFSAIRTYPAATLGLAAMVMFVVQGAELLLNYWLINPIRPTLSSNGTITSDQAGDVFARAGASVGLTFLVAGLGVLILTGAVTAIVGEGVLGHPMTLAAAWSRLRGAFGRLLGVWLLTRLIAALVIVVGIAPGFAIGVTTGSDGGVVLAVFGGLGAAVVVAYLLVSFSLASAAVVLEHQPIRAALRRSRQLVRGSWWRVFGLLLLAWLIASIVSAVMAIPFAIAGGGLGDAMSGRSDPLTFVALLLNAIGAFVAGTVAQPFRSGVTALVYLDRRMRVEALDVTLARAAHTPDPA